LAGLSIAGLGVAAGGWILALAASSSAPAAPQIFTKSQVKAGQQVFLAHCAVCHGYQLQGKIGPALKGPAFADVWLTGKQNADSLFYVISTQMPFNAPGSLKTSQYLEALSYILSQNGLVPGKTAMTVALLKKTTLPKAP
jgi:mono/diheme cytochrome c family protein